MHYSTKMFGMRAAVFAAAVLFGSLLLTASFAHAQTTRDLQQRIMAPMQSRLPLGIDTGPSSTPLGIRINCGIFSLLGSLGVLSVNNPCGNNNPPPPPPPPQAGTLTVIKIVDGGTAVASAFTLHVTGGSATPGTFAGSAAGTPVTIAANATYSVSEDSTANYTGTFSSDCSGTMPASGSKTCTVTNTFNGGTGNGNLTVIKIVNGGSAAPSNFTMHVTSSASSSADAFPGNSSGTTVQVAAGADYDVWEDASSTYTSSFSANCAGIMPVSGTRVCTVTNTFNQTTPTTGSITVKKIVVGGTATSSDFLIHLKNASSTEVSGSPHAGSMSGTIYNGLASSTYTVSESGGPANYLAVFSGDCNQSGFIMLAGSSTKMCTITNTFQGGQFTVMKLVSGGTATSSDFMIHIINASSTEVMGSPHAGSATGTVYMLPIGNYMVFESGGPAGYSLSYSGSCNQGFVAILAPTTLATCMLTNTFTGL